MRRRAIVMKIRAVNKFNKTYLKCQSKRKIKTQNLMKVKLYFKKIDFNLQTKAKSNSRKN